MVQLLKSLSTPIVWILAFMVSGLILARLLRKKPASKLAWRLMFLATFILYSLSVGPVASLLVYSLECRYHTPPQETLSTLNAVVILAGGLHPPCKFRDYPEPSGTTYSRLFNGVRAFKQSGAETLILSGGGLQPNGESEAEVMRRLAAELGVPGEKTMTEGKSRNTMEQAINLAELLSQTKNRRIGLVTSALHMLRSDRAFRKRFPDDTIVPIPVDYIYSPPRYNLGSFVPSAGALLTGSYALHEWIGIVWYSIRY